MHQPCLDVLLQTSEAEFCDKDEGEVFFLLITVHEGHICAAVADQCSTGGRLRSSGGL